MSTEEVIILPFFLISSNVINFNSFPLKELRYFNMVE